MQFRKWVLGAGRPSVLVLDLHGEEAWVDWAALLDPKLQQDISDYLAISADRGARPLAHGIGTRVHALTGATVVVVEAPVHRGLLDANRLLSAGAVGWPVRAYGEGALFLKYLRRHRAVQEYVLRLARTVKVVVDVHTMAPASAAPVAVGERDPRVHAEAWRTGDGRVRPLDVVTRIDGVPGVPGALSAALAEALSPFGTVEFDRPYSPVSGFLNAEVGRLATLASFDLPKTLLAKESGRAFDLAHFTVDSEVVAAIAEALARAVAGWLAQGDVLPRRSRARDATVSSTRT